MLRRLIFPKCGEIPVYFFCISVYNFWMDSDAQDNFWMDTQGPSEHSDICVCSLYKGLHKTADVGGARPPGPSFCLVGATGFDFFHCRSGFIFLPKGDQVQPSKTTRDQVRSSETKWDQWNQVKSIEISWDNRDQWLHTRDQVRSIEIE